MANGWTPERRAKQAQAIHRWRPWQYSTGPRTREGKARVARNGYKGGSWKTDRELISALRAALKVQRRQGGVARRCVLRVRWGNATR